MKHQSCSSFVLEGVVKGKKLEVGSNGISRGFSGVWLTREEGMGARASSFEAIAIPRVCSAVFVDGEGAEEGIDPDDCRYVDEGLLQQLPVLLLLVR